MKRLILAVMAISFCYQAAYAASDQDFAEKAALIKKSVNLEVQTVAADISKAMTDGPIEGQRGLVCFRLGNLLTKTFEWSKYYASRSTDPTEKKNAKEASLLVFRLGLYCGVQPSMIGDTNTIQTNLGITSLREIGLATSAQIIPILMRIDHLTR